MKETTRTNLDKNMKFSGADMKAVGLFDEFSLWIKQGSIKEFLTEKINYDREKLSEYLRNGKKIAVCPREVFDCITGKSINRSFSVLTDGEYIWIDSLIYYVENYNLSFPKEFLIKAKCLKVDEQKNCKQILNMKKKRSVSLDPKNILFEFISEPASICTMDERDLKKGFVIDDVGNYYTKKEVFEIQGLPEEEKLLLGSLKKLNKQYIFDLVFQSSELAEKVKRILEKYSNEICNLPDKVRRYDVLDGSINYFKIGNKSVSGCNIVLNDNNPYEKGEKTADILDTGEEYEKNENALLLLNNIYLEIKRAVKLYEK